jgi:outer membrane protein assembly factor BamB
LLLLAFAGFASSACGRTKLESFRRRGTDAGRASTGEAAEASHPWPNVGRDPQGTRRSPADTSKSSGMLKWKYAAGGAVNASPVLAADGTVYVLAGYNAIYAISPPSNGTSGVLKWSYTMPGRAWAVWNRVSPPAIGRDGTVYVLYDKLYAMTAPPSGTDGVVQWTIQASRGGLLVGGAPIVEADGTVYAASDRLAAIRVPSDGREGVVQWTFDPTGVPFDANLAPFASVVGVNGTVYYGDKYSMFAVNPPTDGASATIQWSGSGSMDSAPAVAADGTVYVAVDSRVSAVDGETGQDKWTFDTRSQLAYSPAIGVDGTVYVTSSGGSLFALAGPTTGTTALLKWSYKLGAQYTNSASAPALGGDGTVYVGSAEGDLYAVSPPESGTTGVLKWAYHVGGSVGSPAIGADGTVYVGSDNGTVCAIH